MTDRIPPINDDELNEDTVASDPHRTRPYALPPNEDTTASQIVRPVQQRVPPQGQHVQPMLGQRPNKPPRTGYARRPKRDTQGALYLPWWSVVLMLLAVLVIAFGLVAGIYFLGNPSITAEPTPIIRIITAVPTNAQQPAIQSTSQPISTEVITGGSDTGQLALEGPTLAPVQFTQTPMPITINTVVRVDGVGTDELNVRDTAGVQGTTVLFRAPEETILTVIDGPTQADGFTWWKVRSQLNPSLEGWAVANFLAVAPNP